MTDATETKKEWTESLRPGTVYSVFKQHAKNELNGHGLKPVYVKPEIKINPNILKYQNGGDPFQTP